MVYTEDLKFSAAWLAGSNPAPCTRIEFKGFECMMQKKLATPESKLCSFDMTIIEDRSAKNDGVNVSDEQGCFGSRRERRRIW